jgi:FkbM family methyltransferase
MFQKEVFKMKDKSKPSLWWLIIESLTLDIRTFRRCNTILSKGALQFIIKKYLIVVKHFFVDFVEGSSVVCDGDRIYYDCRYGIAGYQRILTTHNYLLDNFKIIDLDLVVDVGANVGYFSLMCKKRFIGCEIHAFEPVPEIFGLLEMNLGNQPNIHLNQLALGERSGNTRMSVNNLNKAESMISDYGDISVDVTTLDEQLDSLTRNRSDGLIDLLKIDVETFEQSVLKGASNTLAKTRYIFLEVTLGTNPNYSLPSLMSHLHSKSFDFQLIGFRNFSNKSDGPITIIEMLLANRNTEGFSSYF